MNIVCNYKKNLQTYSYNCKNQSIVFIFAKSYVYWTLEYEVMTIPENNVYSLCKEHWRKIISTGYLNVKNIESFCITKEKYIKYLTLL